jgi:hypothetical protein
LNKLPIFTGKETLDQIAEFVVGSPLVGYEIPKTQSLSCAWELRLYFKEEDRFLCLSSDVGSAGSWREYGYLKCEVKQTKDIKDPSDVFEFSSIKAFKVEKIFLLINKEDDVIAECGITFQCQKGNEIIISTAPSPGAISVNADFNQGAFLPEVLLKHCESKLVKL